MFIGVYDTSCAYISLPVTHGPVDTQGGQPRVRPLCYDHGYHRRDNRLADCDQWLYLCFIGPHVQLIQVKYYIEITCTLNDAGSVLSDNTKHKQIFIIFHSTRQRSVYTLLLCVFKLLCLLYLGCNHPLLSHNLYVYYVLKKINIKWTF